ncbi:MAG: hypothetical protein AAGC74_12935 [Verrucomicrobiota bacterium]
MAQTVWAGGAAEGGEGEESDAEQEEGSQPDEGHGGGEMELVEVELHWRLEFR